jgi:hypothetical protein
MKKDISAKRRKEKIAEKIVLTMSIGEGVKKCIFGNVDRKGGDGRVNSVQYASRGFSSAVAR